MISDSIARIFYADSETDIAGTGCLLSNGYLLTCAHVISDAIGKRDSNYDLPEQAIKFDFPFVNENKYYGRIVSWFPKTSSGSGDVALLEPSREINIYGSKIILNTGKTKEEYWGKNIRSIGFPRGYESKGISIEGTLRGRQATGNLQLDGNNTFNYFVEPGFSGAPVWRDGEDGIRGIISTVEWQTNIRGAFIIPTEMIMARRKDLLNILHDDQMPLRSKIKKALLIGGAALAGIAMLDVLSDIDDNDYHLEDDHHDDDI